MYQVTVGICCYKQKKWLHRCLRSLCSQTFDKNKFEVVIVNDDPSDCLDDIVHNHKNHLNIRVLNNTQNVGLPSSLNKILNVALGRYFVRVDCDDYVSKDFLYMLHTFLSQNSGTMMGENYQAVACDYFKVDNVGRVLSRHSWEEDFIACGVMFTYESLAGIDFYNEDFKMREGHELMKRFNKEYDVHSLKVPLYKYRIHNSNRTNEKTKTKIYDNKLGENK